MYLIGRTKEAAFGGRHFLVLFPSRHVVACGARWLFRTALGSSGQPRMKNASQLASCTGTYVFGVFLCGECRGREVEG